MVPAVLSSTTMTLLRKYRPTCASVHASAYVLKDQLSGRANGLPRKISVLVLKEASTTQISGPAVASAHRISPMCAIPVSALTSRFTAGLRPALLAAGVGTTSAPGTLVRLVIGPPLSGFDGLAAGDPEGQR